MTIVVLLVLLFLISLGVLTLVEQIIPAPANPVEAMISEPLAQGLADILRWLQMGALVLSLVWAISLVGPDFERVRARRLAHVNRGLAEASETMQKTQR